MAKHVNGTCPICKESNWILSTGPHAEEGEPSYHVFHTSRPEPHQQKPIHRTFLQVLCENCFIAVLIEVEPHKFGLPHETEIKRDNPGLMRKLRKNEMKMLYSEWRLKGGEPLHKDLTKDIKAANLAVAAEIAAEEAAEEAEEAARKAKAGENLDKAAEEIKEV